MYESMATSKRSDRKTWLRHARAWKKSGLSCGEFAKRNGLKAGTLSWWTWKLRASGEDVPGGRARPAKQRSKKPQRPQKPRKALPFVEVTPVVEAAAGPATTCAVELEAGGVVVRVGTGFDDAHLCRVLDVLEARR